MKKTTRIQSLSMGRGDYRVRTYQRVITRVPLAGQRESDTVVASAEHTAEENLVAALRIVVVVVVVGEAVVVVVVVVVAVVDHIRVEHRVVRLFDILQNLHMLKFRNLEEVFEVLLSL